MLHLQSLSMQAMQALQACGHSRLVSPSADAPSAPGALHAQWAGRKASLRSLGLSKRRGGLLTVAAKGKGEPPDVPKPRGQPAGGREWLQSILSRFGPVKEKASNTTVLDFEKPLVELDNRIKEVGVSAVSIPQCAGAGGARGGAGDAGPSDRPGRPLHARTSSPLRRLPHPPLGPHGGRGQWSRRDQPD